MTYEFKYLLHLLGCAVSGKTAQQPTTPIDWNRLFQIAQEQTVYPMLLYQLNRQPELYGKEQQARVKDRLRSLLVAETVKRENAIHLLRALEDAGIVPVVLKGYSLSPLYPEPAMRQSVDLDLYVGPENEQKAQAILQDCGVQVQKRAEDAQESVCFYAPVGHIELHAWLMGKNDREAWMQDNPSGITRPFEKQPLENGFIIHTLGDDDNMFFLTLHYIKHFVKYGASLRNILDVALFYAYYIRHHDAAPFRKKIESIQFDKLFAATLDICTHYCGFPEEMFRCQPMEDHSLTDQVLTDIESGGWMGVKETKERVEAKRIYEKVLYNKKHSNKNLAFLWHKRKVLLGLFKSIFCSRKHLEKHYPYVHKSKLLLPVAYLHRLFDGIRKLLTGKIRPVVIHTDTVTSDVCKRRTDLFKQLEIM